MLPSWLNGSDSNNAVVDIKLPDKEYESFVLDLGAGETDMAGFKCGKFRVDCGAGEAVVSGAVLGGLDADQGVGELNFTGTVNGDIDIDGGVGEIVVNLTNPESDFVGSGSKYKIDIDTGIGSKTVNYNVSR